MNFKQLRDIFIFTGQERNGILVLLFILLLTLLVDIALPFIVPEKEYDVSVWKEEAEKYYSGIAPVEDASKNTFEGIVDPNSAVLTDLTEMGIPSGIANNWIKYLQKGGHFKKKEEVRKLYGMTDDLYRKVQGHLQIADQEIPVKKKADDRRQTFVKSSYKDSMKNSESIRKVSLGKSIEIELKNIPLVEVNQADSVQLEALPGIGPVLASRIIKFRRLLGGFYEIAQLKEIYGMSDELWAKSSARLYADTSEIKKIDINFLSLTELGRHPYIGFRHAKKVIKCRDTIGKFTQIAELVPIFSADSLKHLVPYLSIDLPEQ